MKAMVFAAGLGTRLKPITEHTPKALVTIAGKPMLQRTLEHLKQFGYQDVIINVHHHAEQVIDFIDKNNFGLNISFSDEREELLDTGGGLKKASWFFDDQKPFLVINADVISNLDLSELHQNHLKSNSIATLVIRNRSSSRRFLFDDSYQLCGWENIKSDQKIIKIDHENLKGFPFSGIHMIDPKIFPEIHETGKFSIVDVYLRLAEKFKIMGFRDDESIWFDIGDSGKLEKAEQFLSQY